MKLLIHHKLFPGRQIIGGHPDYYEPMPVGIRYVHFENPAKEAARIALKKRLFKFKKERKG